MLICHNINHTTHHADGSHHHLEVPYLKATPGVPVIIDGDDDDGKQILINILSGLTFAQGADIKLFSSSPFALSLAHRHQTIGYFGDKDNFKPLFSVRDNLDLFSGGALDEILCRNLFEFFELDYIHVIDKEYGGLDEEIQMVLRAIGCFIAEPRAYFLHLPFCILPTHFHLVLCELLTQASDNIVIISHQKGHFLPLEGDKYSLYDGKLWHEGRLVEPDASYLDKQAQKSTLELENLVQNFPLPENKEQMVAQNNDSNVFAKFLTPIDDVPATTQENSVPQIDLPKIEVETVDEPNDDQPSDDSTDINMQADELEHETNNMMVDVQMKAPPEPSDELPDIEEARPQEIIEPEIIEEASKEEVEEEPVFITRIDQPEIIATNDDTAQEAVINETIIAETIEAPKEMIEPAIEEVIIAEEVIQVTSAEQIPEKFDAFQQNKQQKFAYQPLDDTDTEIYQPTPSHFNYEPFIPPHADDANIIAKFEQHLHHVPEIGAVFQRELARYRPIANRHLTARDDDNSN